MKKLRERREDASLGAFTCQQYLSTEALFMFSPKKQSMLPYHATKPIDHPLETHENRVDDRYLLAISCVVELSLVMCAKPHGKVVNYFQYSLFHVYYL